MPRQTRKNKKRSGLSALLGGNGWGHNRLRSRQTGLTPEELLYREQQNTRRLQSGTPTSSLFKNQSDLIKKILASNKALRGAWNEQYGSPKGSNNKNGGALLSIGGSPTPPSTPRRGASLPQEDYPQPPATPHQTDSWLGESGKRKHRGSKRRSSKRRGTKRRGSKRRGSKRRGSKRRGTKRRRR